MKNLILFIALFCSYEAYAQIEISGTITDSKQQPVIGASLYIENTYDGGITDENGLFSFTTTDNGIKKLIISYLGYETITIEEEAGALKGLNIAMKESAISLDAVEISASTFKAGDNSKVSVLNPLDIVTTAGSMGDVVAAMQTLPGTQSNAEDGRLFIRGGEARETNIYIDGLKVFSPYSRSIGGTPSRGRYSPFLFKGVSFSTGGYSAAYGQSLSGILDMSTIDEAKETETNISLMTLGAGIGHTQKWDNQSISVSGSLVDFTPYTWLTPTRTDWKNPINMFSGEAVYRYKTEKGLFKSYLAGENMSLGLKFQDLDRPTKDSIDINNRNLYSNTTYNGILNETTSILAGISIGVNRDNLEFNNFYTANNIVDGIHSRVSLKTVVSNQFIANYGIDIIYQKDGSMISDSQEEAGSDYSRNIYGGFVETDYYFTKNLAVKTGVRLEYNSLLQSYTTNPRITLAQKLSKNSQMSLAIGSFTQEVDGRFLYLNARLNQEKSTHYLLNFNHKSEKQIFRIEAFYKGYKDLISYQGSEENPSEIGNNGRGRAYGLDLFWRASQIVKNIDFWVSYSWLNHKRLYRNYPVEATPSFSTDHNLSLVSKIWVPSLRTQVGITYKMASGRPYENPNTSGFLNERSKLYNNISLSCAYLVSPQKILFVSVSNASRFRNEYGYEYASQPGANGIYPGRKLLPNDDQFFFAGFFITLSKDKTKNQLDNL